MVANEGERASEIVSEREEEKLRRKRECTARAK